MIRKTKKGPRRLREMPFYKQVEYVISGAGPYYGSIKPHTAYRTKPTGALGSRWLEIGTNNLYILLTDCAHLDGGSWNVELRKEYR